MTRDYGALKDVWEHFIQERIIAGFYSAPLQDWLLKGLEFWRRTTCEGGWLEKMEIVVWYLWRWRSTAAKTRLHCKECGRESIVLGR